MIEEGELYCWGLPASAPGPGDPPWRTGAFTAHSPRFPPYRVRLPRRVLQVSTGGSDGCALLEGGEVHCFGVIVQGPACEETSTHLFVPVPLPEPVVEIASQGTTMCVLFESRELWCWGGPQRPRSATVASCDLRRVETTNGQPLRQVARFEVGAAIDARGVSYRWDPRGVRLVARMVDVPAARDLAVLGTDALFVTREGGLWLHYSGEARRYDAPPVERVRCDSRCFAITSGGELFRLGERAERLFPERRFESVLAFDASCLRDADGVYCW
ncbi:MAG: hypothetical protein EVA89_32725, partial [Sandaracinaceae bacterium]